LQSIAARKGYEYSGKLQRSKYEALYAVVEKYGKMSQRPEDEEGG
jgi:hypothetical protein